MPNFSLRVMSHKTTAISHQIKEAVRIRNRGGAGLILNSCSEFTRCHIPCLIIKEEDKLVVKERKKILMEDRNELIRNLDEGDKIWVAKNS